ncbi:MAG: hypothetical protein KME16_25295 [Scytolyngbya sp. HA4215-MV1]|nr:hypothetical protein [Scytolyngbya sp. HA4215-MV1]
MNRQPPSLAVTILLYIAGILLVLFAILLLLQVFGAFKTIPQTAVISLVLLGIGGGILAGISTRTR